MYKFALQDREGGGGAGKTQNLPSPTCPKKQKFQGLQVNACWQYLLV